MKYPIPALANWKSWVVCSIGIKIILLLLYIKFSGLSSNLLNQFYLLNSDYPELLGPVDNYFISGTFEKDLHSSVSYAGRLPGYIFPYFFLKMLFSRHIALTLLVVFQIIFSAVAAYMLGLLAYQIFQKKIIFFLFFIFFIAFGFFSVWDLFVAPESISICAYVLHLFLLNRYMENRKNTALIFSGLFLAWAFFLRGFLGIYFVTAIIVIAGFHFKHRHGIKRILVNSFIFLIPLIVMELAWVTRNYSAFGKLILLQTTYVPGQPAEMYNLENRSDRYLEVSLRRLVSSWGGECGWYFPGSEMGWLRISDDSVADRFQFKSYVFYPGFSRDSLDKMRVAYQGYSSTNGVQKDSLYSRLIFLAEHYREKYIRNNQFRYYMITPVMRVKNLVIKNVVADWPGVSFSNSHWAIKCYKAMVVILYFLILIAGGAGMFLCLWMIRKIHFILIAAAFNVFLLLFLFAELIELAHFAYFATGYIGLALTGVFFLMRITNPIAKFAK